MITQLSIFVENKGGTLIKVLNILSSAGVQIIASTVSDTSEYGIYRVICDDAQRAYDALKKEGVSVQQTLVIVLYVNDEVGEAGRALHILSDEKIDISYMYSFLFKGKGVLVLKCIPEGRANELVMKHNLMSVKEEDLK